MSEADFSAWSDEAQEALLMNFVEETKRDVAMTVGTSTPPSAQTDNVSQESTLAATVSEPPLQDPKYGPAQRDEASGPSLEQPTGDPCSRMRVGEGSPNNVKNKRNGEF